ncbi:hypothetical protein SAMN04490197_2775 [Pseudomonas orientalis]|uniref:Uncharacterized protein n=1 Tax=Pseudomonas orientalis TaxID=76758 RepID=A0A1H2FQ50_9PSED|nr:hypothetical protein TU82_20460 [Pseudomonas orientalis]SDU09497.1 hypothetical protein SAMN04490197_2775 [Pseudomonas orientalis]
MGGGLPPIAVYQSAYNRLTYRHREQAPSHIGLLGIQMHWCDHSTIFIRVPQLRINKSMPVLFLRTTLLSGEE